MPRYLPAVILSAVLGFVGVQPVLADFYDSFHDGEYGEDPNVWDIDDPCWIIYDPLGLVHAVTAADAELRMWVYGDEFFGNGLLAAYTDTGDMDPNTSETHWDDTTSHYILVKAKYTPDFEDPNDYRGRLGMVIHGNRFTWEGIGLQYDVDGPPPSGWFGIYSVQGLDWPRYKGFGITRLDEQNGFWMVLQFLSDGVGGDPNGKRLQAACWDGDKYDWDGTWMIDLDMGDPNSFDEQPADYWSQGGSTLLTWTDNFWGNGSPAEAWYDDVECRTGVFTNVSHTLSLEVINPQHGSITIDPDLLADANGIDPNAYAPPLDPNRLRRYTAGTDVMLVAEAVEGKSFKHWKVFDPNHPGDGNYATLDTNAVLYLTMDADWHLEPSFKCGSSVPPFLAAALLALAGLAVIRRFR